jgi:hypothetical protein
LSIDEYRREKTHTRKTQPNKLTTPNVKREKTFGNTATQGISTEVKAVE